MGDHQTFLWILACGAFGAGLGAAFGAVVGALTWGEGRAAGTFLGLRMVRAFERATASELTPGKKGALIGGTDGAAFLGVVGVLVGALVARSPDAGNVLGPAAVAMILLVGGGLLFGLMAYALLRTGVRAVVPLFAGAMLGAAIGLYLRRIDALFTGLLLGLAAGTFVAFLIGPRKL